MFLIIENVMKILMNLRRCGVDIGCNIFADFNICSVRLDATCTPFRPVLKSVTFQSSCVLSKRENLFFHYVWSWNKLTFKTISWWQRPYQPSLFWSTSDQSPAQTRLIGGHFKMFMTVATAWCRHWEFWQRFPVYDARVAPWSIDSLTTGLLRHSPNRKPDNNHHLGRNSGPKWQQSTCVCTCVFACIERSSWLDPGRDHGDGVTLIIIVENSFTMTFHAQIWPVLRD
jgi:hypothetical protein